jgi:hypothetical protein
MYFPRYLSVAKSDNQALRQGYFSDGRQNAQPSLRRFWQSYSEECEVDTTIQARRTQSGISAESRENQN